MISCLWVKCRLCIKLLKKFWKMKLWIGCRNYPKYGFYRHNFDIKAYSVWRLSNCVQSVMVSSQRIFSIIILVSSIWFVFGAWNLFLWNPKRLHFDQCHSHFHWCGHSLTVKFFSVHTYSTGSRSYYLGCRCFVKKIKIDLFYWKGNLCKVFVHFWTHRYQKCTYIFF